MLVVVHACESDGRRSTIKDWSCDPREMRINAMDFARQGRGCGKCCGGMSGRERLIIPISKTLAEVEISWVSGICHVRAGASKHILEQHCHTGAEDNGFCRMESDISKSVVMREPSD